MGASQSTGSPSSTSTPAATVSGDGGASFPAHKKKQSNGEDHLLNSKVINTPIYGVSDEDDNESSNTSSSSSSHRKAPIPTGHEYDLMDQIASDLPSVMDDESKAQVEEYIRSCNNGKGPMVACFSTAEYL
eukprot:CAMPEP_0183738254 /NCGR_PEP_ID=MMETSP0737-20130205/54100_1 /TAXON_ID=385413 /ORGANISM="Thalassiosira miniscula, Strain CCMP1093" /LENGTH=130 /DNA_ID=CAMNT_0025972749 /DNA_START=26 /DNA_END=414 /DNA_ORIENTATION=+